MMSSDDVRIREATVSDMETIIRHRRCMFSEMGFTEEAALDAMAATSAQSVRKHGLQSHKRDAGGD